MDTALVGLTGEFYVLAQLAHRGYVATMTLGNTKQVDIVVFNRATQKYWRIEVKTTQEPLKPEKLFGPEKFYIWQLTEKHERIAERDLIYCFVALATPDVLPKLFLVPSTEVARYVKWQHQYWLDAPHTKPVRDNEKRKFRVEESDPNGYATNWSILAGV